MSAVKTTVNTFLLLFIPTHAILSRLAPARA